MGVCRSIKGIKIEPSGQVWPVLCALLVVQNTVGCRGDVEGMLKIEGVLEAYSLSQVMGFFIAWNTLMRGHVVPFQDSLVCIYGVKKRGLRC